MLTVIQFPIADFRTFLSEDQSGRLPTPSWPPRTSIPPHFVHFFGRAIPRHFGVDRAWVDEQAFCCANRALSFPSLSNESNDWKANFNCAFRRLLSDGIAVARVEVGLSLFSRTAQNRLWRVLSDTRQRTDDKFKHKIMMSGSGLHYVLDLHPLDIVKHILTLPSIVQHTGLEKTNAPISQSAQLVQQGNSLAKLYFHATTPRKHSVDLSIRHDSSRYVAPGSPVVIMECMDYWLKKLPKNFISVPKTATGGVHIAFGKVDTTWGTVDTWIVGCNWAIPQAVRNLRLCLLRLHAEQQVLNLVLDRLRTGTIKYQTGEGTGDKIEDYLNNSTRIIDRKRWGGIQQSAILTAFDTVGATKKDIERADLEQRLCGMRLQVRRKIERFESRAVGHFHFGDNAIFMETQIVKKSINIGNGNTITAPVVIAETIQNSFTVLESGQINSEVKLLIQSLLAQITEVAKAAPNDKASELAEYGEALAKEVVRSKPRREWYDLSIKGLVEASQAIGEIGKPIIDTAAKLLPVLVASWP
ncbi:MAG: hypothetical protein HC889_00025 [Synechococcaceae cyanobacterium SM1_2_3]|nr:hypothetical protein [Synechococcaceae cyanobacterium SM1_2_3]